MIRGTRTHQRIGVCLILLAAPALAFAGRYQPEPKWLEAVRAAQAFLPYRLGVVEFKKGLSDEWREYLGDFRATLRGANYFQQADAPRLRVEIEQDYLHGSSNEDGCKQTPGTLALTYRFLDGDREVNRLSVTTQAPVSGDSNDWDAAMAGNLKFLLLELRKGQGDAQFAQVAGGIEARIREDLGKGSNTGCTVGAVLARGFVAAVEGAVAVVGGLGEVAGAALEVAASPQFQGALNTAMAEQQQQRAQQQASINNLNAQAQAAQRAQAEQQREAQKRAGDERAQEQQAGREAMAKQLAEGIAYRNSQMSKTSDAATLQRLRRDNEAALQAAQQIGMRSKVDGMATLSTQAGFDQARTQQPPQQMPVATSRSTLPSPASNYSAGQDTASPGARPAPGAAVQSEGAAVPGKPLRFVLTISMRNLPGDKVNPTCYSNIISRPGPPGWGAPGFLPPGTAEQARETVSSLKSAFIAQCRASGREITSDGNFNFQMNQSQGDETRLQEMRARYSEDVAVRL